MLNDAYGNMTREERQALLHEGKGPSTLSAYVELVFDNEDNRFPVSSFNCDQDVLEIVLRKYGNL